MRTSIAFKLLIAGASLYFIASSLFIYTGHGHAWILARFLVAGLFFSAFLRQFLSGRLARENAKYCNAFIFILLYTAMISIPDILQYSGYPGWQAAFANAAIIYGFIAFGVVLLSLTYCELILIFKTILSLSFVSFVLLFPQFDPQLAVIADTRRDVFNAIGDSRNAYAFQMSLAYIFLVSFLVAPSLKTSLLWRTMATASLFFVLITALFYSKRATILDLGAALTLFLIAYGLMAGVRIRSGKLRLGIYGGILGVVFVLANSFLGGNIDLLLGRVLDRFNDMPIVGPQSFMHFSRVYEVQAWFAGADFTTRLFGGGTHHWHLSAVTGQWTQGLHIGWAALFVRGGLPLVMFFLFIFADNIMQAIKFRNRPSSAIGLTLPLLIGFGMVHSTVFGSLHSGFAVAFSLFLYPALYRLENKAMTGSGSNPYGFRSGRLVPLPHPRAGRFV